MESCCADIGRDNPFKILWLGALSRGMDIVHSRAEVRTLEQAQIDKNANFCGPLGHQLSIQIPPVHHYTACMAFDLDQSDLEQPFT